MTTVQWVRIFDVFVLGPLMLYIAYTAKGVRPIPKLVLGMSGLMTMLYNGQRYLQIQDAGPSAQERQYSFRDMGF